MDLNMTIWSLLEDYPWLIPALAIVLAVGAICILIAMLRGREVSLGPLRIGPSPTRLPEPAANQVACHEEPSQERRTPVHAALREATGRRLVIHSAWYGAERMMYDVTGVLRLKAEGGSLQIKIDRDAFGDPAVGEHKHLVVVYSHGLEPHQVIVGEHETLFLPDDGRSDQ